MRREAPAQWVVVPPTVLQIQAGRPAKSRATRQLPEVVRLSSHEICRKLFHSSFWKVSMLSCLPASSITTLMPFWASSLPSVPPPAPEPTITTTESSLSSNVAMIIVLPQPRNGGGLASASGCMVQPTSWKPRIR